MAAMGGGSVQRRMNRRREVSGTTVVNGATLGGLVGGVLAAPAGVGAATLAMDEPSGLEVLMPMVYGIYGAAVGILVGGFVGYGLTVRLHGTRANRFSLGLLAGLLLLGGLAGVALGGAPPPIDVDPGWLGPWAVLAVIVVPGPAALVAHCLGARLTR